MPTVNGHPRPIQTHRIDAPGERVLGCLFLSALIVGTLAACLGFCAGGAVALGWLLH